MIQEKAKLSMDPRMKIPKIQVSNSASRRLGGFTIVDLLASVAIVALLTSVVLSNQRYSQSISRLRDMVYSVALHVRQAQSYGYLAKEYKASGTISCPWVGYGILFDTSTETSKKSYYTFVDRGLVCSLPTGTEMCPAAGPNCEYDPDSDILLEKHRLTRGTISQLCTQNSDPMNPIYDCSNGQVSVIFQRSNSQAFITRYGDPEPLSYVLITVSTNDGQGRLIYVTKFGQTIIL
jgi:type II secretory pathway pseudopilin PulG